jgi:hypothetical protein
MAITVAAGGGKGREVRGRKRLSSSETLPRRRCVGLEEKEAVTKKNECFQPRKHSSAL